jgi:hypothetical protein
MNGTFPLWTYWTDGNHITRFKIQEVVVVGQHVQWFLHWYPDPGLALGLGNIVLVPN